jgi:sensor histidine kinase YesM
MTPFALGSVRRRLVSSALWTAGGSLAATVAFSDVGLSMPLRQLIDQTFANCVYSGCCVLLCAFGLPLLMPRVRGRLAFPLDWAVIVLALVAFGTIGSLSATAIGVLIGFVPPSKFLKAWYPGALNVSVYFTLIFGLGGAALGEARTRLEKTTLALRTKERDEAEARRLATEAQLASLESRVDPHFLFNTLNSIAALVRENPAAAERVIEQFAALMRSSLDRRASLVRLDEELALVRSYLEIERVRFGQRLRFCLEQGADVEGALVPRMSLQTLAENAVKYAVSPSREGATITVSAALDHGQLRLRVEDYGPGFDDSHLPDGHGLQLLKSRLMMTFGDAGTLTTDGRPGRTSVTLTLPFTETAPAAVELPRSAARGPATLTCP